MNRSPFQNPFYRALLLIVAFLFLIALPIGLTTELNRLSDGRASRDWPTVPGTILSTSIEEVRSRKTREVTFFPRVTFDYKVAGQAFHGTRFSAHGSGTNVHREAQAAIERYPIGSEHRVYYIPADPASSLLEPGTNRQPAAPFVLIAIFFAAGLTLLGLWYKTLPARKCRSE